MKYNYKKIEKIWQKYHKKFNFFKININKNKKYYILNMFPYPSGYGLHIGHSIGYIYTDIIAKYKSGLGYNILNPIGFDSFGLPAEQYALKMNKLPSYIVKKNIKNYKKQIKNLGVFFNWKRIINTSDKKYYKWTQYIFIKLFNSFYYKNKILPIKYLYSKIKYKNLNKYRLAYLKKSYVNWCPKLNSVLSNDEIENGRSIRGGYKIILKKKIQWHLRITKYIKKLLKDFNYIKWPIDIKNNQIKWIGYKKVYTIKIKLFNKYLKIFSTNKNKNLYSIIFDYPSKYSNIIINRLKKYNKIKILNKLNKINYNNKYKILVKIKNNLNKKIYIYISNYYKNFYLNGVFIKYKKDYNFLKIKTISILKFKEYINLKFNFKKEYIYNLKDIIFSRQRYWGEPIPIYYNNNLPYNIDIKYLPLKLPNISKNNFINKKINLNNINKWAWDNKNKKVTYKKYINNNNKIYPLDTNTMPSSAGSNWYYLRYISPNYNKFIFNKEINFWKNVDLYIGGREHINGHLLYSRFITKFLNDLNIIKFNEPFINFIPQGIILNKTYIIYKYKNKIYSYDIIKYKNKKKLQKIYVNKKDIINKKYLNINKKKYNKYILFKNKYNKILCKIKLEKMSKSKYNIITPDSIINKYGIDCYRLYIMFIGPFKNKKIWNINKINGIKRFLNKIWNYYLIKKYNKINSDDKDKINEYLINIHKNFDNFILHKNISIFMKIFNFIIKKKIYDINLNKNILILLATYVPNITEEIWKRLGNRKSIYNEKINKIKYISNNIKYLILINNKIKDIIYINKNNNNLIELKKKIINKIYYPKKYKKIIFIKNKILNILL
ncbi:MAG: class I tRNA ligase family protein [Candidatus Shikimatogenerans bostrichidophilus]|nr:MAG: class I tRNA ligase family protein [Candidatus Shikimatogenerans bostrichidophilus]